MAPIFKMDTAVGGCSFMIHVRHAAAAIAAGLCETVLITHGERGRSGVGRTRNVVAPPASPASSSSPMVPGRPALTGRPGDADFVHDPGIALHDFVPSPPRKRGPRGKRRGPGALGSRFRGNDDTS